jgi:outer membrane protein assembly factor BamB
MSNKIDYTLFSIFSLFVLNMFVSCTKPLRDRGRKEITSFEFKVANNSFLSNDLIGVISNDSILIEVPPGVDVSNLIPAITISGEGVSPESGIRQNFNNAVSYTVTAIDGSRKVYTVIAKAREEATLYINSTYPNPPGLGKLYAIDAKSGSLKWEYTLPVNADESSPTSYNGTIYMGMGESIVALNPISKSVTWQFPTAYNETNATITNDVVYANGVDQFLYAIEISTGNLKWKYQYGATEHAITLCSPTYANGVVYIGDGDGYVSAINSTTGNLTWRITNHNSYGSGFSSNPAVVNDVLYIADYMGYIYAINVKDGSYKWTYGPGQQIVSSPTVVNGIVYIGSEDNNLYAIDAATGILKWKYYASQSIEASPVVADGIAYVGTTSPGSAYFYAIDAIKGTLIWSFANDADFYSSPVVYNNTVYVGSYAEVWALDAKTGVPKWTFHTDDPMEEVRSSPCIVTQQGNVYNPGISGNQN